MVFVEVGAADAATLHLDEHLARAGQGLWNLL
jgi:hypothetical protein